jgi:NitT/TauT family transport system permease protein
MLGAVARPTRYGLSHAGRLPAWLIRLVTLGAVAIAWEWLGRQTSPLLFAPFSKVMIALGDIIVSGELLNSIILSAQALVFGYLLAVAVGVPLGLAIGRFPALDDFLSPYMSALLATPMIGVAPLILFAFGIDLASRVAVVFMFSVVVVTVNTAAGILHVERNLVEMSRVFGATQFQQFRYILLPGSLPGMFAGLRLGLGQALTGMITAEFIITAVGIGKQLMFYSARFRSDYVLATLFAVIVLATILMWFLAHLQSRALWSWHGGGHGRG